MFTWKKTTVGDLQLYRATTFDLLPDIVQGFTTRTGGLSGPPYNSLNLGVNVGDNPKDVESNRQRLYDTLGFAWRDVATAQQVHGNSVAVVTQGGSEPLAGADALITNTPDLLLMLLFADCVPVYIVDPIRRAIGLIHSGWRGTLADIVGETMRALSDNFGSLPSTCFAAVGPCISGDSYEVGRDVAYQFHDFPSGRYSGALLPLLPKNELTGTYCLDLRQIIFLQLLAAGIPAKYITISDKDTARNRRDFFSYRRDGAETGRMAAVLAIRSH